MLLTDARRPARTGPHGELITMAEQDRSRWDPAAISEGVALITATLRRHQPGPFQLQAAIAAVHDEAASAETTDWPQILALYELLREASGNPVIALNHAVATAMVHGPRAGLQLLDQLADDTRDRHRVPLPRSARPTARDGRRARRRPRRLPQGGPAHRQPAAPALSARPRGPAHADAA